MRKVPKKNVSRHVSDIRHPQSLSSRDTPAPPPLKAENIAAFVDHRPEPVSSPVLPERSFWKRKIISVGLAALFLTIVSFGIGLYDLKQRLSSSVALGLERFNSAVSDFRVFDFRGARENAQKSEEELRAVRDSLSPFHALLAGDFAFIPFLRDAARVYSDIQSTSVAALEMFQHISRAQALLPDLLRGESGGELITLLEKMQGNLKLISEQGSRLVSQSNSLKSVLPIDPARYLALQVDIGRMSSFLDSLIPWLKDPAPHRLAVFLQNPSELRPGGGFVGSYAEVVISGGSVSSIEVRDIAYADRELDLKTVPPAPLQALVKRWRAADANWFFDFPVSAKKTLDFLEASDVYRRDDVRFDGAIGLSARAVGDMLEILGPIKLASGETVTSGNFLGLIQREVQSGHDVGSPAAKRILAEIAPLMIRRMGEIPPEDLQRLIAKAQEWVTEKDAMVFFKDVSFQRFFDEYAATGRTLELAPEWDGDYLAVVNANIGGGKTDVVMKQRITLQSSWTNEGTVNNHLVIQREHAAAETDPWWYRMTNQNYLKIFTPANVQLQYGNGGWDRTVKPQVKYSAEGFSTDPDVEAIERTRFEHLSAPAVSSYLESGKNVFSTWTRTAAGETSEVIFDYTRRLQSEPRDGGTYRFVFEKQSGAEGEYMFEITAPVGFRFRENGLPVFEYRTEDPPARLVLDLTLEQI